MQSWTSAQMRSACRRGRGSAVSSASTSRASFQRSSSGWGSSSLRMHDDGTVKTIWSLSISANGAGKLRIDFFHVSAVSRPCTNHGAGQAGPTLTLTFPDFPCGTTT